MARNRWLLMALGLWAAVSLFFAGWLHFDWGGEHATQVFDDVGEFAFAYIAAAACAVAAVRRQGRTRLAWTLMSVSAFCWGSGQVVWSYYELLRNHQVPFPSFADLGYLAAVPFAVAGVLCFPWAPSRATSLVRTVLDGLLIAGSLFVVSWGTVLGTVYRANTGDMVGNLIGLA